MQWPTAILAGTGRSCRQKLLAHVHACPPQPRAIDCKQASMVASGWGEPSCAMCGEGRRWAVSVRSCQIGIVYVVLQRSDRLLVCGQQRMGTIQLQRPVMCTVMTFVAARAKRRPGDERWRARDWYIWKNFP